MAGRTTQVAAEAAIAATQRNLRATQVAAEAAIAATQRQLRVTQVVAEVVIAPGVTRPFLTYGEPGGSVW